MKRITAILVLILGLTGGLLNAQTKNAFGVVGGVTLTGLHSSGWDANNQIRGRGGVAYRYNLPSGFALQPQLVFNMKAADLTQSMAGTTLFKLKADVGYVELPVQIQWGQLIENKYRPYFFVEPYVGCGVYCSAATKKVSAQSFSESNISVFEYGLGAGVGVEYKRFQLSAVYSWNMGPLCADKSLTSSSNDLKSTVAYSTKAHNFGQLQLNLGIFF